MVKYNTEQRRKDSQRDVFDRRVGSLWDGVSHGASICEHNRQRASCKECGEECGGGCICEHNRRRSTRKPCRGSQICEYGRVRSRRKECKARKGNVEWGAEAAEVQWQCSAKSGARGVLGCTIVESDKFVGCRKRHQKSFKSVKMQINF